MVSLCESFMKNKKIEDGEREEWKNKKNKKNTKITKCSTVAAYIH